MSIMRAAKRILANQPQAQLLWASVREVFNIIQAVESGCNIVTVQHDILAKAAEILGKDLTELSLETVKMFARDAKDSGFYL
jgi:transaldolase